MIDVTKNIDIATILGKQKLIVPIITLLITVIVSNNVYKAQKIRVDYLKQQMKEDKKINDLIKVVKIQEKKFSEYENIFSMRDTSIIMKEVSEFAATSGVKILLFNPLSTIISEILKIMPLNLKIEGSYHEIGDFISKIESSDDVLSIADFQLSKSDPEREGGGEKKEILNANIVINAVFLRE